MAAIDVAMRMAHARVGRSAPGPDAARWPQLVIVADDLTGAADTSACFARAVLQVRSSFCRARR